MDDITQLIRDEIFRQFGSLKRFSDASGIPYSTLSNALARGVGGTSYSTVVKMCKLLNLKQIYGATPTFFNSEAYDVCKRIITLDEDGMYAIKTVLVAEERRCKEK